MKIKSINKRINYHFKLEAVKLLQFLKTDTLRKLQLMAFVESVPVHISFLLINSLAAWNQSLYFLVLSM